MSHWATAEAEAFHLTSGAANLHGLLVRNWLTLSNGLVRTDGSFSSSVSSLAR